MTIREMQTEMEVRTGSGNMILSRVKELLSQTYWAKERRMEIIEASMKSSICFGVFIREQQIAFARVVTDYATLYYVADVIVDEAYRGIGAAKRMMDSIVNYPDISRLRGMLITKDAEGLYEKSGFKRYEITFMEKIGEA